MFPALIIYGTTNDEGLVNSLMPMYQRAMAICPVDTRRDFYTELRDYLFKLPPVPNIFMPFLLVETATPIVDEATIDYAMMASSPEQGLASVDELISFIDKGLPSNVGALYGGLIFLGDARVLEKILRFRSKLSTEEVNEAARSRTEYPTTDAFLFWLDWAEELAETGDTNSSKFGAVMSAMAMIVRDDSVGTFNKVQRQFGYIHAKKDPPERGEVTVETHTRKEFGGMILERLYNLERIEATPKLASDIILRFGYEPRAPIGQQYRDAL